MKSLYFYNVVAFLLLFFYACNNNDITDMGVSIQPEGDRILLNGGAFPLITENIFLERIYNRPDSFLLGRFHSEIYGNTKAEILTQFYEPFPEVPTDQRFPNKVITPDSIRLILYYNTWTGSDASTLNVSVYEMNTEKTLNNNEFYPSDIDASIYVNRNEAEALLAQKTFTAKDQTGERDSTYISLRLNYGAKDYESTNDFKDKMYELAKNYTTQEEFIDAFKGLYITTDLGEETMINIIGIRMLLHYKYKDQVQGRDTSLTNTVTFTASKDVVRINRLEHKRDEIALNSNTDFNFISSPGNIYTRVKVPLKGITKTIYDSIGNNRRIIINNATIRVEAEIEESSDDKILLPMPTHMLLMPESQIHHFFAKSESSFNDSIIFGSYSSTDSCYTFNIAALLTEKVSNAQYINEEIILQNDIISMCLVPVSATLTSSTYGTVVSNIKQLNSLNGVKIRSGQQNESSIINNRPMIIRVIYSGF